MKLQSFELYTVNGYSNNPDILRKRFNAEVRYIINYFSSYFSDLKFEGVTGIRIDLNADMDNVYVKKPEYAYPICRVVFPYDYENKFIGKSSIDQKKQILLIFKKAILLCCKEMNWDQKIFIERFELIEALDFNYKLFWNKPKRLKGSKTKINIETEFQPGFMHYFIIRENPDGVKVRKYFTTLNSYYNYFDVFGQSSRIITEAKWIDANTYLIIGKKGHLERIKFEYKLDSNEVRTIFNLESDINHLEFKEEFEMATAQDDEKIFIILNNKDLNKWHIYI